MGETLDILSGQDLDDLLELASVSHQTDAELEASLRERWGLAEIDLGAAAAEASQGRHRMPTPQRDEDYSEDEWILVAAIRKHVELVLTAATPKSKRIRALRWLFVRGVEDSKGVSFHLACEALESRPWVLQALLQHLIFVRGLVLDPLDPMSDILPEAIQSEAILAGWDIGLRIANLAWKWPSISEAVLRSELGVDSSKFEVALGALLDKGVLSNRMGLIYLTARPQAFRRAGSKVSWSKSFIGD